MAITTNNRVAEMQGLYGPFTMAERVVQKIWLQRDFNCENTILTDGRTLKVKSTGTWNLLGGPDFHSARLLFDGEEITGDIEVHFHLSDWRAHGHEHDPAYAKVVLHVVLFPPSPGEKPAMRSDGSVIPTLVLLPFLHRDLEEYASDDALETITARDEWRYFAELASRPLAELQILLTAKAHERWRQKVYFAAIRLERLGWESALHHVALEILGYRRNRTAMLMVAETHPIHEWRNGVSIEAIFEENKSRWQLQGVRPANHPRVRLQQYQRLVKASPDWPNIVSEVFAGLPVESLLTVPTKQARQLLKIAERRKNLANDLFASVISGTRLDNLVCDGVLPLLAAKTGNDFFSHWFHWFLGDIPDQVRRTLPKLGLADGQLQPLCHGYARGLLGWFLQCEARASG